MELDLLGLGLPPATLGHGGVRFSAGQRWPADLDKTAFNDDEPPRLAAATEIPPPLVRRRPTVDTDGDVVPAPPANKLMMPPWPALPPPTTKKVSVPGAAGDHKSPRASQLGCFRGIFPLTPSELAAGQARMPHAVDDTSSHSAAFGLAAGHIFEGSSSSSSPLTIIYDGSVHAFDSVPMEQAEKILFMTAKEAQAAAEPPVFQQPSPAAAPPTSAAQIMMLMGLANVKDSLRPKRTLSLARFLHKRKQRLESAATATYPRVDELPTQMDPVYALDKAPFGDMGQPWASENGPKSQKEKHGEEEVNTELKI